MLKYTLLPLRKAKVTSVLLLAFISGAFSQIIDYSYRDATLPVHQRVDILLSQMSMEEKVGQLRQCNLSSEVVNGEFKPGAFERIFDNRGAGTLESPFF